MDKSLEKQSIKYEDGELMTKNAKRAITFVVFAVGILLGVLGWTSIAYSPTVGTIVFICFIFYALSIAINMKCLSPWFYAASL